MKEAREGGTQRKSVLGGENEMQTSRGEAGKRERSKAGVAEAGGSEKRN